MDPTPQGEVLFLYLHLINLKIFNFKKLEKYKHRSFSLFPMLHPFQQQLQPNTHFKFIMTLKKIFSYFFNNLLIYISHQLSPTGTHYTTNIDLFHFYSCVCTKNIVKYVMYDQIVKKRNFYI